MKSYDLRKLGTIHVNVVVFPCLICSEISVKASIVLRILRKPNSSKKNNFLDEKKIIVQTCFSRTL